MNERMNRNFLIFARTLAVIVTIFASGSTLPDHAIAQQRILKTQRSAFDLAFHRVCYFNLYENVILSQYVERGSCRHTPNIVWSHFHQDFYESVLPKNNTAGYSAGLPSYPTNVITELRSVYVNLTNKQTNKQTRIFLVRSLSSCHLILNFVHLFIKTYIHLHVHT